MPTMNATAATSVSISMPSGDSIDGVTVRVSVNVLYSVLYSVAVKVLYSIIVLYTVVVVGEGLTARARSTYLSVSIEYVLSNSRT
jgi:hypothetical protein